MYITFYVYQDNPELPVNTLLILSMSRPFISASAVLCASMSNRISTFSFNKLFSLRSVSTCDSSSRLRTSL